MEVVEMHKEKINNSLSNIQDSNGFYYGITDKIFKSIIFDDMEYDEMVYIKTNG